MIGTFGLQQNVIFKNDSEVIFPINCKTPGEVDHLAIGEIQKHILKVCPCHSFRIPVSYHALEMTLKNKIQQTGHIAFTEESIFKEVPNCNFTKESFKNALRYLHKKKTVLYSEKEFPGIIINRQRILDKFTELIEYYIQLSIDPENYEDMDRKLWRLVKYGIITIDTLEKLPSYYVKGVFTPSDMMKLFEKHHIVFKLCDKQYLMPSILHIDRQGSSKLELNMPQSLPTVVLHFQNGPTRPGVFYNMICHILTRSNWELLDSSMVSACFVVSGHKSVVTIKDALDSFFLISVQVPEHPNLCNEVLSTLTNAASEVTKKLAESHKITFICEQHQAISLHPARVCDEDLVCIKECTVKKFLTAKQKMWLKGIFL